MGLLMDGLLMAASIFAGGYCWVLSRRVADLKNLDKGLGGTIVNLTRQIELARVTLEEARVNSKNSSNELAQLSARAETAAAQLRLILATMDEEDYRRPAPRVPSEPLTASRELAASPPKADPRPQPKPERAEKPANRPEPLGKSLQRQKPMPPTGDIPKPRAVRPLTTLLRRPKPEPVASSEDEIMNALHALANGRE